MSDDLIEIDWMGCNRSNKVWGICGVKHDSYYFWGRRGKPLKIKRYYGFGIDMQHAIAEKEDDGYWKVPLHQRDKICPDLREQLKNAIVLDKLRE